MTDWSEADTKKLGGGVYSDPIFDTADIKFYNDPKCNE